MLVSKKHCVVYIPSLKELRLVYIPPLKEQTTGWFALGGLMRPWVCLRSSMGSSQRMHEAVFL